MKTFLFLLLCLQGFAQKEIFIGNTKKEIEADNKFKYYAVVLAKQTGENLTEYTTDWQWVFAIALNKYLTASLDSLLAFSVQSLNSKQNAELLKALGKEEKHRSVLSDNQEIIYIKKLKILYQPKREMVTISNRFKVLHRDGFLFRYVLWHISSEARQEIRGEFTWTAGAKPSWEEIFKEKIYSELSESR